MAAQIRNTSWINIKHLEDTLQKLIGDNFQQKQIPDYMEDDFPKYAWSLRI